MSKEQNWKILSQLLLSQFNLLKFMMQSSRGSDLHFSLTDGIKILLKAPDPFDVLVCFMTLFIEIAWYFPFKHELFLRETFCCNPWRMSHVQLFSYSDFWFTKRLFWFSINVTKETLQSAINSWDSFVLQEDVRLSTKRRSAFCR